MRILLVLDNLSSSCGANVGIVYKLAMTWLDRGNEVYCLAREDKYHELDKEKASKLNGVWSFRVTEDDILNDVTKGEKWITSSSKGKILYILSHPVFIQKMIDHKYFESSEIRNEYKKQIEKTCAANKFDAVIAVTEPFYIADALSYSDIAADKYIIMMDPYTNNPSTTDRTRNIKLQKELHVFKEAKNVFALDFVGNDMNYLPENYKQKKVNFCVPKVERYKNVVPNNAEIIDNNIIESIVIEESKGENDINFVYVGQLYDDIRNPERMLELFTKLPQNYILHLYGGGSENTVSRYKEILKDRLVIHGWVSSEESAKAQKEAHILINLNNNIKNMLPSKLIEYIDTGKPILNICQIDNCPSLPYMDKYPMSINVTPDQEINKVAEELEQFAEKNKNKIVNHDVIEELFSDCISENVADMMLQLIQA